MSPVLPRFPTPPPILGGSGRVCHSPLVPCPSTPLGWLWALLIVCYHSLKVNCVYVRLRFIPLSGFVMWCITALATLALDVTRPIHCSLYWLRRCSSCANAAPRCGPVAPRQLVARQPGGLVGRRPVGRSVGRRPAVPWLAPRFLRPFFVSRRFASLVPRTCNDTG